MMLFDTFPYTLWRIIIILKDSINIFFHQSNLMRNISPEKTIISVMPVRVVEILHVLKQDETTCE